MKLGICTSFENIDKAASFGFDYIEVGLGSVASLSDHDFTALAASAVDKPIRMEAANVMLPGPFHVTGENADHREIRNFLTKVFPRLHTLGCEVVVFGSGGARRIPEGFPMDQARQQLKDACITVADIAADNGITIVLEPLNRNETNIINSVSEGGQLVREISHPSLKLLADYYHIGMEGEGLDGVLLYGTELRHAHLAHPTTRKVPFLNDGGNYEVFFETLKKIGYHGRVSFEGRFDDFDQQIPGLASFLRSMMI